MWRDSHVNNWIYKQTDGVAMGSPSFGPYPVNIFMCHWEEVSPLVQCLPHLKPLLYKHYIDDTFLCYCEPDHHSDFLKYLNSQHNSIKFTGKVPSDNFILYLDTKVSYTEDKFQTQHFRKPSFKGLGTYYNSCIFSKFKINSLYILLLTDVSHSQKLNLVSGNVKISS